jgi:hypothetical protein
MGTKDTVRSELVLRLTEVQVVAILRRIERRKRKVAECAQIDLGEIDTIEKEKEVAAQA